MIQLIAQTTQPVVSGMTIEEIGVRVGIWSGVALVIIAAVFKIIQFAIAQWFGTKKFIEQQKQTSQEAAAAIVDMGVKMAASPSIDSPNPALMAPVVKTATGTGDGSMPPAGLPSPEKIADALSKGT